MERKIKNGKREYQTFARLQMQIDCSVDDMAEAIETVLNLIEKQKQIIDLMADQLTTPVHNKEWVIDYYKTKIQEEN